MCLTLVIQQTTKEHATHTSYKSLSHPYPDRGLGLLGALPGLATPPLAFGGLPMIHRIFLGAFFGFGFGAAFAAAFPAFSATFSAAFAAFVAAFAANFASITSRLNLISIDSSGLAAAAAAATAGFGGLFGVGDGFVTTAAAAFVGVVAFAGVAAFVGVVTFAFFAAALVLVVALGLVHPQPLPVEECVVLPDEAVDLPAPLPAAGERHHVARGDAHSLSVERGIVGGERGLPFQHERLLLLVERPRERAAVCEPARGGPALQGVAHPNGPLGYLFGRLALGQALAAEVLYHRDGAGLGRHRVLVGGAVRARDEMAAASEGRRGD
eukprot:CAMPEP_0197603362 /NCGR_PEP_ID=MMETSP1326-20131121/39064_1 /TAXON_ID=1155430 /ORGANISM="Genus nov. species nov., Strain RCC2288" /LENGTH=324 /DNA_ID=CAMNT_0043170857 /DNA_START=57 /DNA_END=1030 /DNA_ORIENTATION=-